MSVNRSGVLTGAAVLGGVALFFGGWYLVSCIPYSEGYRDGTVQKVSRRGVVFKTVEGEAVLGGFQMHEDGSGGGTMNRQTFHFTVADHGIATQLEALPAGRKVRLHYRQSLVRWPPAGDTRYLITAVEIQD